mgnify:CR=1 FL=1
MKCAAGIGPCILSNNPVRTFKKDRSIVIFEKMLLTKWTETFRDNLFEDVYILSTLYDESVFSVNLLFS